MNVGEFGEKFVGDNVTITGFSGFTGICLRYRTLYSTTPETFFSQYLLRQYTFTLNYTFFISSTGQELEHQGGKEM